MLLPLLSLAGGLFLLTREQERPVGPQPIFPPELISQLAVSRSLEGGGVARYFKQDVSDGLVQALAGFTAQQVGTDQLPQGAQQAGLIFRLVPMARNATYGSEQSAQEVVTTAQRGGFIVLATLSTFLLSSPDEKLVMVCEQSHRRLASAGSQWAILLDAAGAPKVAEPPPQQAQSVGPAPFDANLPRDVVVDLSNLVSQPGASAQAISSAAEALDEGVYPLTVSYLRGIADAIALRERVRSAAGIKVPEVVAPAVEVRSEIAAPGQGEGAKVVLGNVMEPKAPKQRGASGNGAAQA